MSINEQFTKAEETYVNAIRESFKGSESWNIDDVKRAIAHWQGLAEDMEDLFELISEGVDKLSAANFTAAPRAGQTALDNATRQASLLPSMVRSLGEMLNVVDTSLTTYLDSVEQNDPDPDSPNY